MPLPTSATPEPLLTPFWLPPLLRLYHAISQRLQPVAQYLPLLLLLAGIIFYIAIRGGFTWAILEPRSQPPEIDDVYTYLWNGARIPECMGLCPALVDVDTQITQVLDYAQPGIGSTFRSGRRILTFYVPLSGAIYQFLHRLGMSWETTYETVMLAGVVLQAVAIATLMSVLWGRSVAGIVLFYAAVTLYPGQGLHAIVPSNIVLMAAFLVWAAMLKRGHYTAWILLASTPLLMLLHPAGVLYSAGAWGLFVFPGALPKNRADWLAVLGTPAMIAGFLALNFLLDYPRFGLKLVIGAYQEAGFREVLAGALPLISSSLDSISTQGVLFVIFIVAFALLTLDVVRRVRLVWVVLMLGSICFITLFNAEPVLPEDGFRRVYIGLQIVFFAGVMAHVLITGVSWLALELHRGLSNVARPIRHNRWLLSLRGWILLMIIMLTTRAIQFTGDTVVYGVSQTLETIEPTAARHNWYLNASAAEALLEKIQPGERVLYHDETVLSYFLVHGLYQHGAVVDAILQEGSPDNRETWLTNARLKYSVAYHPVWAALDEQMQRNGVVLFSAIPKIDYQTQYPMALNQLQLYVMGGTETFEVHLTATDIPQPIILTVPAEYAGWLQVETAAEATVTAFTLEVPVAPPNAGLQGLRFSNETTLNWAWAQQADLTLYPLGADMPVQVSLRPSTLAFHPQHTLTVLDDAGLFVLAQLAQP